MLVLILKYMMDVEWIRLYFEYIPMKVDDGNAMTYVNPTSYEGKLLRRKKEFKQKEKKRARLADRPFPSVSLTIPDELESDEEVMVPRKKTKMEYVGSRLEVYWSASRSRQRSTGILCRRDSWRSSS